MTMVDVFFILIGVIGLVLCVKGIMECVKEKDDPK